MEITAFYRGLSKFKQYAYVSLAFANTRRVAFVTGMPSSFPLASPNLCVPS